MKRYALVLFALLFARITVAQENTPPQEALPITPPALTQEVAPIYPEKAMAAGIEAEVILEIDIDETGQVEGVFVLTPATPAGYGFDQAAVDAANLFEFEPAKEGDTPIPVRITFRSVFALEEVPEQVEETSPATATTETTETTQPAKVLNYVGRLRERGTRIPLAGVTVTVFRGAGNLAIGYEAITNKDGRFKFYDLEAGEWMVLAEADGYYPVRTREEIVAGKKTEANYFIERSEYNPFDVVIQGEQLKKEVSRTSLDMVEVEKVPGTFGDVLTVVQNLPGVARTGPTAGNIVVRGSSSDDTQIFIEGVEVPIIYHFGGFRSVVPVGMLDSLDFYPGNFSSQFGRATGGVVDVRLKKLNPEQVGGYADVNLTDSGVYLETPIGKKAALAVAARRSYIDGIIKGVVPPSANLNLVTAPRYYDYQVLADVRPNSEHAFTGFFFGSDDELKILFDNPSDFSPDLTATSGSTNTNFYRTLLQYSFTPSPKFQNELKTSAGRNKIYAGVGDQVFLDLNTYVAQIKDNARLSLGNNNYFNFGVDYVFNKADARIKFPQLTKEGEPGAKPDLDTVQFTKSTGEINYSLGGYVELESRLFERWSVIPGVRFDYFSRIDDTTLAPRFNTRFDINDKWTVKGGVGLYYQQPSFDETDDVFGNPELGVEKATHYSAGFEYQPLDYLTLDVVGFYKDMDFLVSRTTETVQRGGQPVPLNYVNGGNGRVMGMELLLRHDFANNFNGWISYTLSQALRKDYQSNQWRKFDFDQTHILAVLGNYKLPRNWSVGFRWRLVSGSPSTPRTGSVYSVDDGLYEPVFAKANSRRLPAFHQLDVRVDKQWIFNRWIFTAYLDVQNIYNRQNITGYSYNYDSSQKRPRQGLPLLPILGVKGEF